MSRKRRRRALLGLAGSPLLRAAVAGAAYAVRGALAERRHVSLVPEVPNAPATPGFAAAVAVDELFVMPIGLLTSLMPDSHFRAASAELDEAVRFYDENGWLNDPSTYFRPPPSPDVHVTPLSRRRGPLEMLRFDSGWEPRAGEPGGERWRGFEANRTASAVMLRHPEPGRPWLVCLHGQGMGKLGDVETFHVRQLHRELGVNVLLPLLPLHGDRRAGVGLDPSKRFVSNVYPTNNVLGFSQTMWELQRILRWLREVQQASGVGVFGFSLGSYAASLIAALDEDLACVIAVVPQADLAEALGSAEPSFPSKRRAHHEVHDWRSTLVHRVVSPLAQPCLVPRDRRFIVAGQGDRVAPPAGAAQLWKHWEEPSILWRPRGHLTTARQAAYHDHIAGILRTTGLHTT